MASWRLKKVSPPTLTPVRPSDRHSFHSAGLLRTLKLQRMRGWKILILALPLAAFCLLLDPSAFAQVFGFWRGPVVQNNPPPTEFIVARWRYNNNGNIGGMGWAHNYPEGEMHLN